MGALETDKFHLFSERALDRCAIYDAKYSGASSQLEGAMSSGAEAWARAKSRQDESLGYEAWKIAALTGPLKQELLEFIWEHEGVWEDAQKPLKLQPLTKGPKFLPLVRSLGVEWPMSVITLINLYGCWCFLPTDMSLWEFNSGAVNVFWSVLYKVRLGL